MYFYYTFFTFTYLLAPEVLIHHNHTYTVDYFAMGVLTYELMMGKVRLSPKPNISSDPSTAETETRSDNAFSRVTIGLN